MITFVPKTPQEAYDLVEAHLTRPGARQAVTPEGECLYRTTDGNACAIGAGILDEEYDPAIEGLSIRDLVEDGKVQSSVSVDLLVQLQAVHDADTNWEGPGLSFSGIEKLNRLARDWRLDP